MRYGAIYYPEHWPEARWPEDARLMREAGFNVVRLGEFAWCRMEPTPDAFDFAWLERAMGVLDGEGIGVLLGTPTAGPPAWLVNPRPGEPDCRMVYEDGRRWQFGGRSLCCPNHPHFVERSHRIAAAMGEHFATHPAVVGFQLDNELGMYGTRCHCGVCEAAFRGWLRTKYGSVAALNERLGMVFGSNEFLGFDDVPLPRRRQDLHHPGLLLDSQRFFSDSNAAYLRMQAEALRAAGVRQPITTNVCHMFAMGDALDGQELFAPLDVAGWDCYPSQFASDPRPATMGLLHAIARGYKRRRYWMLEQQSGSPMAAVADDPRRSRLWTWQSIAHGAEMILYFRWRTGRFGGEQDWRGILDHDGQVNDRYRVIAQVGREICQARDVLEGLRHEHDVAILLDFDSHQSLVLTPAGGGIDYRVHAEAFYAAARKLGQGVDVVYGADDLARYRIVVAPMLRLIDAPMAARLTDYVLQGGTLVLTALSASLDRDHVALPERPPYFLQELFGIERVEWSSLGVPAAPPKELTGTDAAAWSGWQTAGALPVEPVPEGDLSGDYAAGVWCDHLRLRGAECLARFGGELAMAGCPALTRHAAGTGRAVYVAGVMDQAFYDDLIDLLLRDAAPSPVRPASGDGWVEVVPARSGSQGLFFVLNHDRRATRIRVDRSFRDALGDRTVDGAFELDGYDVALLTEEPPAVEPQSRLEETNG